MNAAMMQTRRTGHAELYAAYLVLAVLDVCFTHLILTMGGWEVNGIAANVLAQWGTPGLAALKGFTVVIVLACCQALRAKRERLSVRLAEWAVAISMIPVVVAGVQIAGVPLA